MKPAYVHDLREQGAVCETNFMRLRRILRDFERDDERLFRIEAGELVNTDVTLTVVERFRYTATVRVALRQHHMPDAFARQTFHVRVYLDANTSEVMNLERTGSLKGVYTYPNPNMYQADEKAQLNRWLSEWLGLLGRHGLSQSVSSLCD